MPKKINITEQKSHITNAAIHVINEVGLEGARLRDVARIGNMTTGAVTHYFDGKDAVISAALDEIVRRTLKRIGVAKAGKAPKNANDFIEQICCYLPIDDESRKEWRVWLAFWGRAIADEKLRKVHRAYYRSFVDLLVLHLTNFDEKSFRKNNDGMEIIADAIIGAIDGIGTRATLEPEEWPVVRQQETLKRLLAPMVAEVFNKR